MMYRILMAGGLAVAAVSASIAAAPTLVAMDTGFGIPEMVVEQRLDMVRELGYSGVAWTLGDPVYTKDCAIAAERRGLRMSAIYCGAALSKSDLATDPRFEATLASLKGHDTIVWLHIASRDYPKSSEEGDAIAVPALRAIATKAAAGGLSVSIYPHFGDWSERFEDALRLARKVNSPNLGATFNLAHWLRVGGTNLDARLEQSIALVNCVTLNGATPGADLSWSKLIQPLDRGEYDWAALVRNFRRRGFGGPFCLQLYGVGGDKRNNLKNSMAAWRMAILQ
jgi:sugar phosphate isomerase/epimerase